MSKEHIKQRTPLPACTYAKGYLLSYLCALLCKNSAEIYLLNIVVCVFGGGFLMFFFIFFRFDCNICDQVIYYFCGNFSFYMSFSAFMSIYVCVFVSFVATGLLSYGFIDIRAEEYGSVIPMWLI